MESGDKIMEAMAHANETASAAGVSSEAIVSYRKNYHLRQATFYTCCMPNLPYFWKHALVFFVFHLETFWICY